MSNSIIPTSNGQTTEIITVSQDEWDRDKTIILNGLKTINEVNLALKLALIRVNSSQSYFLDGYKSFEECCKGLFKISERQARRLMDLKRSQVGQQSKVRQSGRHRMPAKLPKPPSPPKLNDEKIVEEKPAIDERPASTPNSGFQSKTMDIGQVIRSMTALSKIDLIKAIIESTKDYDYIDRKVIIRQAGQGMGVFPKR